MTEPFGTTGRTPDRPASLLPTILVTALFGVLGSIAASIQADRAKHHGLPVRRYWKAFGITLGVALVVHAAILALVLQAVSTSRTGGAARAPGAGPATSTAPVPPSPTPPPPPDRVVRIGVLAPISGDLTSLGEGVARGVELAAKEANEHSTLPGWRVEVVRVDDEANPDAARSRTAALIDDPQLAAVVGPLNSTVATAVLPAFEQAGVAVISPAATGPALTHGTERQPQRQWEVFFRVIGNDDRQPTAAAQYVFDEGKRRAVVVHADTAYGTSLASRFADSFRARGGTVASTVELPAGSTDVSAALARIRRDRPDVVYVGGEFDQGGPLAAALDDAGIAVPIIGPDGLYANEYIDTGGRPGDLATTVGVPMEELPTEFLDAFQNEHFWPPQAFDAYGYDAANTVIDGLRGTLPATGEASAVRRPLVAAIATTDREGVTGPIRFDRFGDVQRPAVTVHRVEGRIWQVAKVVR